MTVIAQNVSVTYTGSGSVGPFGFNFPISSPAALKVIQNNALLPSTAYTITPVNNNYDNGGSVLLNAPCPVGQSLVLQRSTPLTQASVFADNLPQPMEQLEAGLDKLTEIAQELAANQGSGGGGSTLVTAGIGIVVTGNGTTASPYIVSLAQGFSITAFMGGQSGELGQQFVNPSFTAAYSGSPTSASITNTDSINSPFNLTSPFTSASLTGTFTHSTTHTTTFTLTASNGATSAQATQTMTWAERIFGGVGAPGASSTVTASGNNAHLSTGDNIPSAQLGPEAVGQTFGPFNPSGQAIYLLLANPSHTFIDAGTGFPFAFNTPTTVTFVNQYGVTVTMYLYQSTNTLSGSFQPKVAS